MAQRVQTLLIDDLDGGEAEATVRFALDGAEYEIDLNTAHAGALREVTSDQLCVSGTEAQPSVRHEDLEAAAKVCARS